jgi:septum formation protein
MLQRPVPRLILASASASRRALLAAAGLRFDVQPADIDEAAVKRVARAADAALELATLKARRIAEREPDAVVIGADQILVQAGEWFDKPPSVAAAREQLCALRGRSHVLATAVVCQQGARWVWRHVAEPRLTMRGFSDDFLDDYLRAEGDDVTSTVGAYRLEGQGIHLIASVEGEHSAILGLPMLGLLAVLRDEMILLK